jgi:phosphoglycolate phosphatase-like HAD superfamily hydrolase
MSEAILSDLVIFDLDGVITNEAAYWDAAGLTLHELLYSPRYWNVGGAAAYHPATTAAASRRISRSVLPEALIVALKARSVNSNWDTCYAGFCLYIIELLSWLPDCSSLLPLCPEQPDWIVAFRQQLTDIELPQSMAVDLLQRLEDPIFQGYSGLALLQRFNVYASERLGQRIEGVFGHYTPSWYFCEDLFQQWYLGDKLYASESGHASPQPGKPGCMHFEQPLLPLERIRAALESLRQQSYTLGIATGRPRQEALIPLSNYGLLRYFDERHIVTYAEVERAEEELRVRGKTGSLVKPHPYPFLRAADPDYRPGQPVPPPGSFVVVGDTPSDVSGGHAAGALVVAVLTGAHTTEARARLEQSGPDFIIEDMTQVPRLLERIDSLATIQRLQFSERAKAEMLLRRWFVRHMNLPIESVTLTPRPVSLNSFNGIYRLDGEEYFFKTHVEEQGILKEYYHAELLHNAGYNIVRPLRTVHEKDQQMVVYPVVRWPVMFDLLRAVETGHTEQANADLLIAAERRECEKLLVIYEATLEQSTAQQNAQAPVHQLFWHRLAGGRFQQFYAGKFVPFPEQDGSDTQAGIPFTELLQYRWSINGASIGGDQATLGASIERAKVVLDPERAAMTVIGHGDAHSGNVFLERQRNYLYFDPAFAGRHSPLLDIVKPFFHNIFATWMYFPREVARDLQLTVALRDATIYIEHNYALTPVRRALLATKREHLLKPLIAMLRERGALPGDWEEFFRLALMCCPLLTINLLDRERIPAAVCWLGLSQVMAMAHLSLIGEDA